MQTEGASGNQVRGGAGGDTLEPGAILDCAKHAGTGTDLSIEPLADLDLQLPHNGGRQGFWYEYSDGTGTTALSVEPNSDRTGGGPALHFVGEGFSGWGAGVGFVLGLESMDEYPGCVYDASAYSGVTFWARGNVEVRAEFQVADVIPEAAGGTCWADCYDAHGLPGIELTPEWQQYFVDFSDADQAGWGRVSTLDLSQLYAVQWKVESVEHFDIWLDDIAFVVGQGGEGGVAGAQGQAQAGAGGTEQAAGAGGTRNQDGSAGHRANLG